MNHLFPRSPGLALLAAALVALPGCKPPRPPKVPGPVQPPPPGTLWRG